MTWETYGNLHEFSSHQIPITRGHVFLSPGDRKGDMLHQRPAQGAGDEEAAEGVGPEGAEQGGKSQRPKPLGNGWEMAWKREV